MSSEEIPRKSIQSLIFRYTTSQFLFTDRHPFYGGFLDDSEDSKEHAVKSWERERIGRNPGRVPVSQPQKFGEQGKDWNIAIQLLHADKESNRV